MKTQVELYEIEDVRAETPEQCEEARKLVAELGLEGQLPKTEETETSRFPYRLMTDEEQFVYKQLCPSTADVHKYRDAPIPLEVLKTIAFAKSLKDERINYLEVWSADSTRVKDPVLVGRKTSYGNEVYILARWGEELLPLDVLLPDAIKRWYASRIDKLNEIKAQVENAIRTPAPLSAPHRISDPYVSL